MLTYLNDIEQDPVEEEPDEDVNHEEHQRRPGEQVLHHHGHDEALQEALVRRLKDCRGDDCSRPELSPSANTKT